MPDITPADIWNALITSAAKFLRDGSIIVGAILVAVSLGWNYKALPQIEMTIDERLAKALQIEKPVFMRFASGGFLQTWRIYHPNDNLPVIYFIEKNAECNPTIIEQFYRVESGRVLTRFSNRFVGMHLLNVGQADIVTVDTQIPDGLPDGTYFLRVLIDPDRTRCPDQTVIDVPASMSFRVQKRAS